MHHADESHIEPYRDAARHYGADAPGFKAALWGSRETQVLRFDVMLEMIDLTGCSVVDIGCGTGDLAKHLIDEQVGFERFTGIDAVQDFVVAAEKRKLPGCSFHVRNVLADLDSLKEFHADYALISGTLNTMDEAAARRLVEAAYHASAQAVVFNFLSNRPSPQWRDRDLGPAQRFDTLNWLDWALSLSARVSFTQEYLDGHDATILIRH